MDLQTLADKFTAYLRLKQVWQQWKEEEKNGAFPDISEDTTADHF